MQPNSIAAYLQGALTPLVQAGLMTPAQLEATVTGLTTNIAQFPLGTIAPDQRANAQTPQDLVLSYRNFGDVDFWGTDLSAQFIVNDKWSFRANGSFVSEECFDFNNDKSCGSSADVALNAPAKKGAFTARWDDAELGLAVEGRVRYSDAFPMNSGVYVGTVDEYTVLDANVTYRLAAIPGATLNVTGSNLFDNLHQEFIGAPQLGRLLMFRVEYEF
jgi:iron complex outermembrane receptor protein